MSKTYTVIRDNEEIVSDRDLTLKEANAECKQRRIDFPDDDYSVVEDYS